MLEHLRFQSYLRSNSDPVAVTAAFFWAGVFQSYLRSNSDTS